ncbi:MAG: TetR/AcrR family transcriptional regulator [Pseudomonadales bacterium]
MPYSSEHKQQTRASIIESARVLFNQHGFDSVTIDMVMNSAGLTRGGFYNHFNNKEELHSEAVSSFLMGRGAQWRAEAGVNASEINAEAAQQMLQSYLSDEHLEDIEGQCPLIALASDAARSGPAVKASYQQLLEAMVGLYDSSLGKAGDERANTKTSAGKLRKQALTLAALSVGGMILARTLPNSELASEVRKAAYESAVDIIKKT